VKGSVLWFFGLVPAMGTEPVTAGVSWQNIVKHSTLTVVYGPVNTIVIDDVCHI